MRVEWRPLAPGELDHELVWGAVGLAAAVLAGLAFWARAVPPVVCPLSAWAGLPCPTCGSTRAFFALAAGDAWSALRLNPLTTLALLLAPPSLAYATTVTTFRLPRLRVVLTPRDAARLRLAAWGTLLATWMFLIVDGR